ncbi:hypothetical protein [Viridibacillus arvi]|uniref:Uncharacterized protein n=1 Tax=Viridibacillus arvi TaxID=263475 RepID=A0A0M0LK11_9BACL|nr:hypothetical protein [Viridibacillus arvi]KOO51415.1 hypothetical protein AMD00_02740 [Viridibacillus arvi]
MIRNKVALISSIVILGICMYLYFPFPYNVMVEARSTFMSFPIHNQDGYIVLGIIGSVLFIIAMILLVIGIKKYQFRTLVIVVIIYTILPKLLITIYQETLASGIMAISYDGNGKCDFENVEEDLLNGECNLVLHNRSNEAVSFDLEFLDSYFMKDEVRMESLMNLAGPYSITIEANREKSINLKELLDLSDVPKHIEGGTSFNIHIKLIEGETARTL